MLESAPYPLELAARLVQMYSFTGDTVSIPSAPPGGEGWGEVISTLFNATGRRSRTLADCQIAAVALRCGARDATGNAPDFIPLQKHGLTLA